MNTNEKFLTHTEIFEQQQDENARRARALWITSIVSVMFVGIGIVSFLDVYKEQSFDTGIWALGLTVILSLAGLFSLWLAWRKRVTASGVFLLAVILASGLTTPILADGQGIAIGVLVAILGVGITAAMLPHHYSVRANSISLLASATIILLDQIVPSFGLASKPVYTNVFAVILSVIFLVVIVRQFNNFTLRTKIVIAFTFVTTIPLIILGLYNNYSASQILQKQSRDRLSNLSLNLAEQLDKFIQQEINTINTEAKQNVFVEFMMLRPQERSNSVEKEKAQKALQTLQRKNIVFIDSYGILDTQGKNVLDTSDEDLGRDESKYEYFAKVMESGLPYASNIMFIEEDEESIYFSAPIKDSANRIIGVLRVEYHATIIQSIVRAAIPSDPGVIAAVVDANTYTRIGYTGNRDRLFKSYKQFNALELAALQAEGRLPQGGPEEVSVGVDPVITNGIDRLGQEQFFEAYSGSLQTNTINTGRRLQTQPWVALVHESYASNLRTVEEQTRTITLLSLALAGLAILLAIISAQFLAAPIISLTTVAEQIASGDISARAKINTMDEIGALANAFNHMTDELNLTLNSLEQRVTERTLDLEIAQQQTQKRADELQSISEISRIITSEQKIEILLPLITRIVSEKFGFDHTGIFLMDETGQYAVLQAASSEGGKRMLARGHRLELGSGIVGYVAKSGVSRIALDVGQDAVYFNNPDMPSTRSEMALPLRIRGRVIGVFDVQSNKPNAFTETDAKNLSILTDQISIAVENARLFERTQQTLNEIQMLYRQNLQESWLAFTANEAITGYRQTIKGGEKLSAPVESEDIREVMNRGAAMYWNAEQDGQEPVIIVPIKLRGQVIGTLKVKEPSKKHQWSKDEINLVEAISDRLSIALENARLIQESQRQVIKQQTIRDMTEKISASINLKNVLQTAVEELGRMIPGSEVVLKLAPKEQDDQ